MRGGGVRGRQATHAGSTTENKQTPKDKLLGPHPPHSNPARSLATLLDQEPSSSQLPLKRAGGGREGRVRPTNRWGMVGRAGTAVRL